MLSCRTPPRGPRVALAHAPLAVGVDVAASDAGVGEVVVLRMSGQCLEVIMVWTPGTW